MKKLGLILSIVTVLALLTQSVIAAYSVRRADTGKQSQSLTKEKSMALETTEKTFEADVLKSELPVLVDFWAPWCGPCRMVGPVIDAVSKKVDGSARVYKVNVDENPAIAARYGISGIPTVIIFRNGAMAKQFVGVQPEAVYLNALN